MRPLSDLEAWFDTDPQSRLHGLATVEDHDASFVSCYLDMRAGQAACHAFLKRKVASIRQSLRGIERFEFDSATELIHASVQSDWNPQAQGMIIFARGVAEDRDVEVLHAAVPIDNRLVRYAKPEILPLIALHQREPAFSLLLAEHDRLQLFERRTGSLSSPALLHDVSLDDGIGSLLGGTTVDQTGGLHSRFFSTLSDSTLPLLIAGDADELADVADWLPQAVIDRLVGMLPYVREDGLQALMHAARAQVRAIVMAESNRLAQMVIEHEVDPSHAVTGYHATLQAIRKGKADTVVIADWDQPGLGLPWEEEIGLCHEALRSGARIVLDDSLALREAGGVGCLLRTRVTNPMPRLSQPDESAHVGLSRAA